MIRQPYLWQIFGVLWPWESKWHRKFSDLIFPVFWGTFCHRSNCMPKIYILLGVKSAFLPFYDQFELQMSISWNLIIYERKWTLDLGTDRLTDPFWGFIHWYDWQMMMIFNARAMLVCPMERFGRDIEADFWSRIWGRSLVWILNMNFNQLVIWRKSSQWSLNPPPPLVIGKSCCIFLGSIRTKPCLKV